MASHVPAPLSETPPGRFTALVEAAKHGRLVLYLGAGISMAEPSCGPTGWAVADALRPLVARVLKVPGSELDGLTLEELAQRVEDSEPDRLPALRAKASAAADFRGLEPNFGHRATALLLAEGLATVITVNWDCAIERAGLGIGVTISGVADLQQSIAIVHALPLYKVHGCATRPETLAITQAEVDRPQQWAVGRVLGALAGGEVAFVGLGTVGMYVHEPLEQLAQILLADSTNVVVADPKLSDPWVAALGGERAKGAHVACFADVFLDDLLRAVILDALDDAEASAFELLKNESWAQTMVDGLMRVRGGLDGATADSALRWWRDGVVATMAGTPFVTGDAGQQSILAVAQLAGLDGGEIEVVGAPGRQTVASSQRYFEIVCRPNEHINRVQVIARDRIARREDEGVYTVPRPVTVVVAGARGTFPDDRAPADIATGDADPADLLEGAGETPITIRAAEDGVRGRLVA